MEDIESIFKESLLFFSSKAFYLICHEVDQFGDGAFETIAHPFSESVSIKHLIINIVREAFCKRPASVRHSGGIEGKLFGAATFLNESIFYHRSIKARHLHKD